MKDPQELKIEDEILQECCETHWVDITDIKKLLEAEDEFKTKSRRSWINVRLLDEVKTMIDDENNKNFSN